MTLMVKINLNMKRLNQNGEINLLLIPLVLVGLLLVVAIFFGFSVYQKEQDYKTNSDQKSAAASKVASDNQQKVDEKQFIEEAKQPLVTYKGPSAYGSLRVSYPKTWSVYVIDDGNGGTPVDGYGYPGQVPDISGKTSFALRYQVVSDSYDSVVNQFQGQLQQKTVSIKPYHAKQVPSTIGVEVTGAIEQDKLGTMVILPLRAYTLKIWTETPSFENDFNKYILPNFNFSP